MNERYGTILPWVYAALALLPAIVLLLTGQLSSIVPFHIAARICAVTAFAMLLLQPVLSARFHWMERPFGLDRILVFHRKTGIAAVFIGILHPVFLALGSGSFSLFTNFDSPWQITVGRLALLAMLLYGAAAVYRAALRIPFQLWLRMHSALAVPILAGVFVHSWFIAVRYMPLPVRVLWFALGGLSLFSYLHLSVFQRLRARLSAWTVTAVENVTPNVREITLAPPKGRKTFDYLPGQFMFLTLLSRNLPAEEHPFTIASCPEERGTVSVAIKESGDFTALVGRTAVGDRAAVLAPYGRFSCLLHPRRDRTVFIAGGIGITPMLSMLRHMSSAGASPGALLFYGNRTEADIAFRSELEGMEFLRTVHVLSSAEEGWQGETGRIGCALMERYLDGFSDTAFYICGPPPMMEAVAADLMIHGVRSGDIHMERFSL